MTESHERTARRRGLAKGLSALLGDAEVDTAGAQRGAGAHYVPIEFVRPSPLQPRRRFDDNEIDELAKSISGKGVLQPVIVRPDPNVTGSYEIVAGERRWRAAQLAKLHQLPVIVRELSDREVVEISLVENVQRENLSPLEEANGYQRLVEQFGRSQEELAKIVGKSRSHLANTLRLLALPDTVKSMLDDGKLTAGHARALLPAADPEALAREVIARGLNVRQTEALVRRVASRRGQTRTVAARDADTRAVERTLSDHLGLVVRIRPRRVGGSLEIRYRTADQLDDILRRLGGERK